MESAKNAVAARRLVSLEETIEHCLGLAEEVKSRLCSPSPSKTCSGEFPTTIPGEIEQAISDTSYLRNILEDIRDEVLCL